MELNPSQKTISSITKCFGILFLASSISIQLKIGRKLISVCKIETYNAILEGTHVRDFPLKIIGGATAAKMQKAMCNCI